MARAAAPVVPRMTFPFPGNTVPPYKPGLAPGGPYTGPPGILPTNRRPLNTNPPLGYTYPLRSFTPIVPSSTQYLAPTRNDPTFMQPSDRYWGSAAGWGPLGAWYPRNAPPGAWLPTKPFGIKNIDPNDFTLGPTNV